MRAGTVRRSEMWKRREEAGEILFLEPPFVNCDVALPLDKVAEFEKRITPKLHAIDPEGYEINVAHLGDGNVHYTAFTKRNDPDTREAITEAVEDVVQELGGSFSAEHGVGISKLGTMARRKDPAALDVMRAIKRALDPKNILNPGKVIPL